MLCFRYSLIRGVACYLETAPGFFRFKGESLYEALHCYLSRNLTCIITPVSRPRTAGNLAGSEGRGCPGEEVRMAFIQVFDPLAPVIAGRSSNVAIKLLIDPALLSLSPW
jgi:hypothetical protein